MRGDSVIDIVKFERSKTDILIGYRQNNAVVYTSVSADLDDITAKQRGYEQVRKALEYELSRDEPSIDGTNMESLETFIPQEPQVKVVKISGDRVIVFNDATPTKEVVYNITALDQYGEIYSESTIIETITNDNYTHTVTATVSGITASLNVHVYKYVAPAPPEPTELEMLQEKVELQDAVIEELLFSIIPQIAEGGIE